VIALDLSNLCRDGRLLRRGQRADLELLDRFRAGAAVAGFDARDIVCVADDSLRHLLSGEQRSELARMERRGEVEFSAVADARLLEMAFGPRADAGLLVASMDNFDDFRREIPAIQGCRDRFLGWDRRGSGVSVHVRDMGVHSHHRLSRKEEDEFLRERRLRRTTIIDQAATQFFRCESKSCLLAQCFPARIPELPRYDDRRGVFVCPVCAGDLTSTGQRSRASQLIVFVLGEEQFRILVPEGETVALGRDPGLGCIGLEAFLPASEASVISARHISFERSDGAVVAVDCGSKNGSVMRARTGVAPDIKLVPHEGRVLDHSSSVVLPGSVTIELSGRAVPVDGVDLPEVGPVGSAPRVTRMLTRR